MRRTTGMIVVSTGLIVGLSACGSSGTKVFERDSNSTTSGVAQVQPGKYKLDLSCTDKRRTVGKKKTKSGARPSATFSTTVNDKQVKANTSCSGSSSAKFTVSAPTTLDLQASVTGNGSYQARLYKQK